jgi:geranylgeranyl pyrophosphate synthase
MSEAHVHVTRALEALQSFHPSAERTALDELARYIVDRSY